MVKTLLKYGTGLIAVFLVVQHTTESGGLINASTAGAVNVVKAFQGR